MCVCVCSPPPFTCFLIFLLYFFFYPKQSYNAAKTQGVNGSEIKWEDFKRSNDKPNNHETKRLKHLYSCLKKMWEEFESLFLDFFKHYPLFILALSNFFSLNITRFSVRKLNRLQLRNQSDATHWSLIEMCYTYKEAEK